MAAGQLSPLVEMTGAELAEAEDTIQRGMDTFVEVGNALLQIRDGHGYRLSGYGTFEDYCRERWAMARSTAYQMIDAAVVVGNLSAIADIVPITESQARPLASLPPAQQQEAWARAQEIARNDGGKITAAIVQLAVEAMQSDNGRVMKPKTNYAGDLYTPNGYDACQTPAYAVDPLLPYIPERWLIWEPASGEDMMVEAFYDAGRKVVSSDIITGKNFFKWQPKKWNCQITNPPYSIKYDWLERSYALGKPFALLLPVETLGAKTAQLMFDKHGIEIILLDKRVNFKMPNKGWDGSGAQFPVAWFTWKFKLGAQIVFAQITPDK